MKRSPNRPEKNPASPAVTPLFPSFGPPAETLSQPAVCVELGALRIHVERATDVQTVLQPLLQVASQKNLSLLLGVSPRTLLRWQQNGTLPAFDGQTLAQIVGRMVTIPGSSP